MGCKNPVQQVAQEAELVFPGERVACVVSIGTGHARTISIPNPRGFQRELPAQVGAAMRLISPDCGGSTQDAARRFGRAPGIYCGAGT